MLIMVKRYLAQWAKLPKKAVCRSVFLKRTPLDCFIWQFCQLGVSTILSYIRLASNTKVNVKDFNKKVSRPMFTLSEHRSVLRLVMSNTDLN